MVDDNFGQPEPGVSALLSGLAALPAGIVLLLLGVVTLWRSRWLDDPRRRYSRPALIAIVAFVAFIEPVWLVPRCRHPTSAPRTRT